MGRVSLALLFWLAGSAFGWCQTSTMQFAAYPPDQWSEKLMGDHAWRIFATGEIDTDAGKRLAAIIAEKHIPFLSFLYLHSPGGSLTAGMALGRVIRENRLNTSVGQLGPVFS
jgi:ATP-dependent protease ClpP protease subunit